MSKKDAAGDGYCLLGVLSFTALSIHYLIVLTSTQDGIYALLMAVTFGLFTILQAFLIINYFSYLGSRTKAVVKAFPLIKKLTNPFLKPAIRLWNRPNDFLEVNASAASPFFTLSIAYVLLATSIYVCALLSFWIIGQFTDIPLQPLRL